MRPREQKPLSGLTPGHAADRSRGHSGITLQEARIVDLWDGGQPARRIASRLGLPLDRVRRIVALYHAGTEHRDHRAGMEAGSAALAARVNAARAASFSTSHQQEKLYG